MSIRSPFEILGIEPGASHSEIRNAWRLKAASRHPDTGGSHQEMVELNEALANALAFSPPAHHVKNESPPRRYSRSFVSRDLSCFTINALPVDAWSILFLCASECGPIIDEEEPYLLEFMMHDTCISEFRDVMCRCEIAPEAGGSTVHVSVYADNKSFSNVEMVRDYLVSTINSEDLRL
jgi:hypothetical protein